MSDNTLHSSWSSSPGPHLISDLVSGKLTPGPIWQERTYRLKFLLRSLLFYRPTCRMLECLSQRADFEQLLSTQITLPSKTHRQYLCRELSARQRADAIISHYQFLDTLTHPRLVKALTSVEPVSLLTVTGKDESTFTLAASSAGKAEREGESTLWFFDSQGTLLASSTFCVTRNDAGWELIIGGLQGPRRGVPHEVIKTATRACFGLFPKRILLEFLGLLAERCAIHSLSGVGDKGHVFRALRYRFSKGRHFHASYDEFWASMEGQQLNPWRWQLPRVQPRKSLDSIASKKRAEYRRRFALLDDMAAQCYPLFNSRKQ